MTCYTTYCTTCYTTYYTGADVEITESYVNFGNIACGTSSAHMIPIKNNSQRVKAVYQVRTVVDNCL